MPCRRPPAGRTRALRYRRPCGHRIEGSPAVRDLRLPCGRRAGGGTVGGGAPRRFDPCVDASLDASSFWSGPGHAVRCSRVSGCHTLLSTICAFTAHDARPGVRRPCVVLRPDPLRLGARRACRDRDSLGASTARRRIDPWQRAAGMSAICTPLPSGGRALPSRDQTCPADSRCPQHRVRSAYESRTRTHQPIRGSQTR